MRTELQNMIEEQWWEFEELFAKIIAIPSVKSTPQKNAPFGNKTKEALCATLSYGSKMGFKTKIIENGIGYAQWGEGNEYIGIIGHLDVVPAGDGWQTPPFQLTKADGKFYGRGVLDNKGPILGCLFALMLLKRQNRCLRNPVRIIFGTDEESGGQDIPLYLNAEPPPIFGFTPDCKFPVVYGERGIVSVRIMTEMTEDNVTPLTDIIGNQAASYVPDQLETTYAGKKFSVKGKRAPSNAPEQGKNAITLLAKKLQKQVKQRQLKEYLQWLTSRLHEQHEGQGVDLALADEASGKLQLTPYRWQKSNGGFTLDLTIRYPISFSENEIMKRLRPQLPANSQIKIIRSLPSVKRPKDTPMVKILSEVYEKITGLDGTPVTTTGATYARFMPNIVAFGPSFPGQKGIAHKQNEYVGEADLKRMIEIYYQSILSLAIEMKGE